jgi:pyruvate dehydrogenase E2 component (dihydrolipoamide acetyltransferase)
MMRSIVSTITRRTCFIAATPQQSCRSRPSIILGTINNSVQLYHQSTLKLSSDLPSHNVVGMPALSPTMESGVLAEWYVSAGTSIKAGDVIAKIETDKASMDFEAQDDAIVATLLIPAGDGIDRKIGEPIMITVDDEAHVAAFTDYTMVATTDTATTATAAAVAPMAASPPPPPPPPPVASSPTPTVPPITIATTPAPVVVSPPPATLSSPIPTPPAPTTTSTATHVSNMQWGMMARTKSPLAATLRKNQKQYIELYGTTGQLTI